LRTGDLASFQKDCLFICGRIKYLIINKGVNFYPQDIEAAVEEVSPVCPACVAAFSTDEVSGVGSMEVVFEIQQSSRKKAGDVVRAVHLSVLQKTGLLASRVVTINARKIPKTTSGKIQRRATRTALHAGRLEVLWDWELENNEEGKCILNQGLSKPKDP
jgi:acyl-CoA synthetase (AMP-forming)/AMP-acid ligase II